MKNKITNFLFLQIIKISFSIVPLWNLKLASIELVKGNDYYEEFPGPIYGTKEGSYNLKIKVYKDWNGIIRKEKYLSLDGNQITGIDYDEIESVYKNNNNHYFVCPKGQYYVHSYNIQDSSQNQLLEKNDVDEPNNWDLKCFYQPDAKMLLITHLNSENKFYEYVLDSEKFKYNRKLYNGIFAFKWQVNPEINTGTKRPMYAVIKNGNVFEIKYLLIDVKPNESFGPDGQSEKNWKRIPLKSKYLAFFKKDESTFYYINYNNANDFESGYSIKNLDINYLNENDIKINNESPFKFVDKITINEIRVIYETQFVYYNITNINKNKFYYGIIDIKLNKIIFNTDEDLIEFKPFSSTAMYAKTKNVAYKICQYSDGSFCHDKCWKDPPFIDSTNYNKCEGECSSLFLEPDHICVDKCNNFLIQDNNKCLLCKDKYENNKFKLINFNQSIDCLEKMPDNSEYINENLYIVACKKGFDLLEKNNCVKSCSSGNFQENHICKKCDSNCEKCEKSSKNCTKCKFGEYLDKTKFTCNKCSNNCESCSDGEEDEIKNCLTCKKDTQFKYLYNKTCIEQCPNDTIASSDYKCIKKKKDENNQNNEDNVINKDIRMLFIFIIITNIFLLTIMICFCKSVCCRPKMCDESLINEITTELI